VWNALVDLPLIICKQDTLKQSAEIRVVTVKVFERVKKEDVVLYIRKSIQATKINYTI
jgi:hypothetical protein